MKIKTLVAVLCLMPGMLFAAERTENSRTSGVARVSMAANRNIGAAGAVAAVTRGASAGGEAAQTTAAPADETTETASGSCREEYRTCMDEFCLLEESEGNRCACSSNINQSKKLIQEIEKIQSAAEDLYTEGVARENMGAKAALVFGQSDKAKNASRASGLSFTDWLRGGDSAGLDADEDIGDNLYMMAANYCADRLSACENSAEMEEALYSRMVVNDCKSFGAYLANQKKEAQRNKQTAEAEVYNARFANLDITNKYNRGECLMAYKSCISDKGGCGVNFENCLDAELLGRRANACDNILDQCMAVKNYVLEDWAAESKTVLADAALYAEKNMRNTCEAKIWACLEDNCSTATNSTCLTNVRVAAGICPIIDECNELIPSLKATTNDKLAEMRTKFCQKDVDACFQEKCGKNYNSEACIGKKMSELQELCPQKGFASCTGEKQFNIIVQSVFVEIDHQMMTGCLNHFSTQLGNVCGTDMSCLPADAMVATLMTVPNTEEDLIALRAQVSRNSEIAVDEFFKKFEKDVTVAACKDSIKPVGRRSLGDSIFSTAKQIAEVGAEGRAMRQLDAKIAELLKTQSVADAEQSCKMLYKPETPDRSSKNYSYIKSVSFEPSLCNCHVCRMQQVCATGGEDEGASGLKAGAGGLAAGASAGTMVMPGWGTAIGGAVGMIGGFAAGFMGSKGEQEFCQEVESCEDINIGMACNK